MFEQINKVCPWSPLNDLNFNLPQSDGCLTDTSGCPVILTDAESPCLIPYHFDSIPNRYTPRVYNRFTPRVQFLEIVTLGVKRW